MFRSKAAAPPFHKDGAFLFSFLFLVLDLVSGEFFGANVVVIHSGVI